MYAQMQAKQLGRSEQDTAGSSDTDAGRVGIFSLQTTPDKRLVPTNLAAENSRGEGGHKRLNNQPEASEASGLYWEKTDVDISALTDADQLEYTVTGHTRRKKTKAGVECEVNQLTLAIIKVGKKIFCVDAKCPHKGGPLAAGDIEDIAGKHHVICPWHRWTFNLETGDGARGMACGNSIRTYPTRVEQDGKISVGFCELSKNLFLDDDF